MPNPYEVADYPSSLFRGLSGFWQRFFRDTKDLEAFYQASEQYLGQVYLDLLSNVLSTSINTTPVFNKEMWKLFAIAENELSFWEGQSAVDDRFIYDMPGTTVDLDTMQNSILSPTVVYEKGLNIETVENDGYLRFFTDPFRETVDDNGDYGPAEGVAWRWADILVGNAFYDTNFAGRWPDTTDVRRGNTLRVLAYRGTEVYSATTGQLTYTGTLTFQSAAPVFTAGHKGDVIEVYGDPGGTAFGRYVIKSVTNPTTVVIDETAYLTPTVSTAANLSWRLVKALYYDYGTQDREIDFFEDNKFIGRADTPFETADPGPFLYAVIREPFDDSVAGVALNPFPASTDLGTRHLKKDLVDVYATRLFDGRRVKEDVDYTVDYLRGVITPIGYVNPLAGSGAGNGTLTNTGTVATFTAPTVAFDAAYDVGGTISILAGANARAYTIAAVLDPVTVELADSASVITEPGVSWRRLRAITVPAWDPTSAGRCSYQFHREVMWSANGVVQEQETGRIRQLSLWVPETSVDRFTLYNNFGAMLNRFEASSETYRAFLKGIMYLYVSGPILQRIESALNVAAGYPVVLSDGEEFATYDSGLTDSGADGVFTALTSTFSSVTAAFTTVDIGGYLIVKTAINDINRMTFRVISLVNSTTVEVETDFGLVDEVGMTWEFSRTNKHTLTTTTTGGTTQTYNFPYSVPMRTDFVAGLTFDAFEVLTSAFVVTDYLIDPTWWHNKYIPEVLWGATSQSRRLATSVLFAHVFDPIDEACFDDPGLFFDGDEEGVLLAPVIPFTATPVPVYRHTAAFILFDRFLKAHMFYVGIDNNVDLSQEFLDDVNDLVLVAKPSYTYPYVDPGEDFRDIGALTELFNLSGINFDLTENLGFVAKSVVFDHDVLLFDDYYYYRALDNVATTETAPLAIGATFTLTLPALPPGFREHYVAVRLNATKGTVHVVEGTDYSFDTDPASATYGQVEVLTAGWDAGAITFDAQTVVLYNASLGNPDTTIGLTPLAFDGLDPAYLRDSVDEQSMIDRAIMVSIDTDGMGTSYIYT